MLNIAIMGYGVVGNGVAEVIRVNSEIIKKHTGDDINIKYILDLRDFPGDINLELIIHDFNLILDDPEIKIVAEVMGGVRAAYDYTSRLLKAGKSVVTSNKELVAKFGDELLSLAAEHNVRYMFEASVGGGIPIITPLEDSLAANDIKEIFGIVNGTSNYILSAMKSGKTFDDALKEAQKNGYAENDPSADIDGKDSCRKIVILAAITYGILFDPDTIPTRGIRNIKYEQVEAAEKEGCSIKLIAHAVKLDNGKLLLEVAPYKVKKSNPLANIEDVYNGILVCGNNVGDVMFYGKGAGSMPTASAVVSDIIHIATHIDSQHQELRWRRASELLASEKETAEYLSDGLGERL